MELDGTVETAVWSSPPPRFYTPLSPWLTSLPPTLINPAKPPISTSVRSTKSPGVPIWPTFSLSNWRPTRIPTIGFCEVWHSCATSNKLQFLVDYYLFQFSLFLFFFHCVVLNHPWFTWTMKIKVFIGKITHQNLCVFHRLALYDKNYVCFYPLSNAWFVYNFIYNIRCPSQYISNQSSIFVW